MTTNGQLIYIFLLLNVDNDDDDGNDGVLWVSPDTPRVLFVFIV